MALTLDQASIIVDTALAAARTEKMNPLTVVVLDAGGHLKALKREDGSGILRVEVASGKAYGALGMGISSRKIRDNLVEARPTFVNALAAASGGRFIPVPGGVLIKDGGEIVGAVGVTGDTSEKDEYAAIEGIKAAGLASDPEEPDPNWQG
ncbi:MAG TPA: heme-binding protein [Alphaproteobacteria bacterium]|nr:heme-binding protein [Alphaproteobacteria bacterium]